MINLVLDKDCKQKKVNVVLMDDPATSEADLLSTHFIQNFI